MRIEQLEYIAAVVQGGSLRRASREMHISQPAMSEAVSKLERELGVTLLDRRRSGARISRRGRDLQPFMVDVLESVARLRTAAGDGSAATRTVRVGTVGAATSTLLVPAVRDLRLVHPQATVDMVTTLQADIHDGLLEGVLDIGLVNLLDNDPDIGQVPADLSPTVLVQGRPVAVLPTGHPLADAAEVTVDALRGEPFVAMRSGYLMHRFAHRLFDGEMPAVSYSTEGAELGKIMVAEGLGLTVLPDYSVLGDPLVRGDLITTRPLAGDRTTVSLVAVTRRGQRQPEAVRDLHAALVRHAAAYRSRHG